MTEYLECGCHLLTADDPELQAKKKATNFEAADSVQSQDDEILKQISSQVLCKSTET